MRISEFIERYQIKPADAIAVKKNFVGLLNHYLVYLGEDAWGQHVFMANYTKGTRVLTQGEISRFANHMHPVRVRRFSGSEYDRELAVDRALELRNQDSYHLILNNCEHFASYVQTGKASSAQTNAFGAGLTAAGIVTTATSKSDAGKAAGVLMAGLGLLTLLLENIDD